MNAANDSFTYDVNTIRFFSVLFFLLTAVFGALCNMSLCYVILKTKSLRTHLNSCIMNIAIADLMSCFVLMPLRILGVSEPMLNVNVDTLCGSEMFVRVTTDVARLFFLAYVSYERYLAIANPFNRDKRIPKVRALISTCIIWMMAVGLAAFSTVEFSNTTLLQACRSTSGNLNHGLVEIYVIAPIFSFTVFLIILFYILIIRLLMQHRTTMSKYSGGKSGNKVKPTDDTVVASNKPRKQMTILPETAVSLTDNSVAFSSASHSEVPLNVLCEQTSTTPLPVSAVGSSGYVQKDAAQVELLLVRQSSNVVPQSVNLVPEGVNFVQGSVTLVQEGVNLDQGGTNFVQEGANLVPEGANLVSDGANLVPHGVNLEEYPSGEMKSSASEAETKSTNETKSNSASQNGLRSEETLNCVPVDSCESVPPTAVVAPSTKNGLELHTTSEESYIIKSSDTPSCTHGKFPTVTNGKVDPDNIKTEKCSSSESSTVHIKDKLAVNNVMNEHRQTSAATTAILEHNNGQHQDTCVSKEKPYNMVADGIDQQQSKTVTSTDKANGTTDEINLKKNEMVFKNDKTKSIVEQNNLQQNKTDFPDDKEKLTLGENHLHQNTSTLSKLPTEQSKTAVSQEEPEVRADEKEGDKNEIVLTADKPEVIEKDIEQHGIIKTKAETPVVIELNGVVQNNSVSLENAHTQTRTDVEVGNSANKKNLGDKHREEDPEESKTRSPGGRVVRTRKKGIHTVNVVGMDGSVHKESLTNASGAVCKRDDANKVRGRRKVELKAAKRIIAVIGTFITLWIPFPLSVIVSSGRSESDADATTWLRVILLMSSVSAMTSLLMPILNGVSNKQIKSAALRIYRKLVCARCKKTASSQ